MVSPENKGPRLAPWVLHDLYFGNGPKRVIFGCLDFPNLKLFADDRIAGVFQF